MTTLLCKSIFSPNAKNGLLVFASIVFCIGYVFSKINIALPLKLCVDFTLNTQSISLHIFAIFCAYKFCDDNKSIEFFAANIQNRFLLIVSIFFATTLCIFLIDIIFAIFNFILYLLISADNIIQLSIQLFLFALSASLLGSIFIALAIFSKPFNAFIYSIFIFFIGNGLSGLFEIANQYNINSHLIAGLFWILPNFEIFNMLGALSSNIEFNFYSFVFIGIFYFALYVSALIAVTYANFKNKPL